LDAAFESDHIFLLGIGDALEFSHCLVTRILIPDQTDWMSSPSKILVHRGRGRLRGRLKKRKLARSDTARVTARSSVWHPVLLAPDIQNDVTMMHQRKQDDHHPFRFKME